MQAVDSSLGLQQALEYLGRYTHRVEISNQRLLAFDGQQPEGQASGVSSAVAAGRSAFAGAGQRAVTGSADGIARFGSVMSSGLRRQEDADRRVSLARASAGRWTQAERFKNRTMIERVFGRLKDEFGCSLIRVRGSGKVMAHLMYGILALSVDQWMKLTG